MRKRNIFAAALALATISGISLGRAEPGFTDDAIVGVWESVIAEDVRVVQMDLRSEIKDSFVAISVGRRREITTAFSIQRVESRRSGEILVEANELDGTDKLVIRGKGIGSKNDGRINAIVALKDANGLELNHWKADFVNLGGRYIETIASLAQSARRQIETRRDQGKRASNSGQPPPAPR